MQKPAGEPFLCIPPGMVPPHPSHAQSGDESMPMGMPVSLLGFNKNPGPYSGWAHCWGEGILVDFAGGDCRGWSGARGAEADQGQRLGGGCLPESNPILSSLLSLCSLVALTIRSSPLLRDGLSLRLVQAALAVLYMALKDIWNYLDGLWSSGKKDGFGLLSQASRAAHVSFQVLRIQLTFLLLKPHASASFPSRLHPSHPPGGPLRAPISPLSFQEPLASLFGQLVLCAGARGVA